MIFDINKLTDAELSEHLQKFEESISELQTEINMKKFMVDQLKKEQQERFGRHFVKYNKNYPSHFSKLKWELDTETSEKCLHEHYKDHDVISISCPCPKCSPRC